MSDYTLLSLIYFIGISISVGVASLTQPRAFLVFIDLLKFKFFRYRWVDKFFTLLVVGIIINTIVAAILHLT